MKAAIVNCLDLFEAFAFAKHWHWQKQVKGVFRGFPLNSQWAMP